MVIFIDKAIKVGMIEYITQKLFKSIQVADSIINLNDAIV